MTNAELTDLVHQIVSDALKAKGGIVVEPFGTGMRPWLAERQLTILVHLSVGPVSESGGREMLSAVSVDLERGEHELRSPPFPFPPTAFVYQQPDEARSKIRNIIEKLLVEETIAIIIRQN